MPRSPKTTRSCATRPTGCWRTGSTIYDGNLLVVLPDAFGTPPSSSARRTGWPTGPASAPIRCPPIEGGEQIIAWWRAAGRDPREKLMIFSDGIDVDTHRGDLSPFRGRVRIGFGWGTNLTNDFRGCAPDGATGLEPFSLVCKVAEAHGRPAVKLSDNPEKASGPASEIERYRRVFGAPA